MAVARVPLTPALITAGNVRSSLAVRGHTWQALAATANWNLGRGGQLVPTFCPMQTIADGVTYTYRFKVWPRYQATRRIWIVGVRAASGFARVSITPPTGAAREYEVGAATTRGINVAPLLIEETGFAQSAAEAEVTLTIERMTSALAGDTGASIEVTQIGCFEVPRPELALETSSDAGVNVETCRGAQPIIDANGVSVGGVVNATDDALTVARRCGLFAWATDETTAPATLATATKTNFFGGHDPIHLARKLYRTSTVGTIEVRARAKVDASTTGNLIFTMASGDTLTLAMSSTSWGWLTGQIDVDAEDLTASDGRRSTRWDHMTVEWQRTAGSGSIYCAGICTGEA